MKHYIYLLLAVIMFAACGSSKRMDSSQKLVVKDSVNIRDSIVFKDSVMVRYEYNLIDSVKVRDSLVLVLDSQGNILSKERYRDTERNQKSNKNESIKQKQYGSKKLETDKRHDMDKNIQKEVVEPPSHKWGVYVLTGLFICFILFITWYFRVGYKK